MLYRNCGLPVLYSSVMTIAPSSPSGSGSPVSGSTICTTNASSKMCRPSCAGHSTDTHCTSWNPYDRKYSTPNVSEITSGSPMFGSALSLRSVFGS